MKKMLLLLNWLCRITGCAQQTFTVQNKPAAVAPKEPSPSFLRFWNWAEENCHAANCGTENVVKQKPSKHLQMDCSVLLLSIYTPLKQLLLTIIT